MGFFERIKSWFSSSPADLTPWRMNGQIPVSAHAENNPIDTKSERRPVIGISGSGGASKSVAAMVTQIRAAGGEPRFIGEHATRVQQYGGVEQAVANDLKGLDALVVLGNDGDIDPEKYNAVRHKETKVETDLARAAYEETAIRTALESGMPLLGICGGMQRINVLGGGTLHQHVPDLVGDNHHMQGDLPPFVPVQLVKITGGSKLGAIAGKTSSLYTPRHQELPPGVFMENSFHHQAVKDLRSDFQVSALSDDGIIEAIEPKAGSRYDNQYVMGIQWHPEFGASDLGPKIASSVTSAARAYARAKDQQTDMAEEVPFIPLAGGALEKELLRRQQNFIWAR